MARLEAIAKGLYYPTPLRVIDMIADLCPVEHDGAGRLLDVCAGMGEAAAHLARRWGLDSYGVELNATRAAIAKGCMTEALHGSYHQLQAPASAFQVLFLNPPYDTGDTTDKPIRQEIEFLSDVSHLLAPEGVLVFIPPAHILDHPRFQAVLSAQFTDITVRRFPDPEYAAFRQVVVIARRKVPGQWGGYHFGGSYSPSEDPLGSEDQDSYRYGVAIKLPRPTPDVDFYFNITGHDPHDLAPGVEGAYRLPKWKMLTGDNDLCSFERPLVAPRPGHIAMLLAAGSVNGTEIEGRRLVKGSSEKIAVQGVDEDAGIEFSRERIVSLLSVLDLDTGETETWRTDENPDATKVWFDQHGPTLAAAVRRDHPPIFDGDLSAWDFSGLQAPGILHGHTEPTILDAQKRAAAAVAVCWRSRKSAVISGEMGVGKTTVATTATRLANFDKTVVICPTHLVKKWMREAKTITRDKKASRTATCLADVDAFFADKDARYLILSKERAKLGARWGPATMFRRAKITRDKFIEADDGRQVATEVTTIEPVAACPSCGAIIYDTHGLPVDREWLSKTKRTCRGCSGALWTALPITDKGTKRWPLAKYLNERHSGRYALIMDEAHQYAGASSDQSRAVQLLCTGATHILAMTGTLYGGRASSIFHLLYKVDPRFRDIYKYEDSARFVQDHGLLEEVHKLDEYTSAFGNRRQNSGGRVREIPGVNPAMINLLLGYTVFLKLADLGHKLPPFEERVVVMNHDPEVLAAATVMAQDVKTVIRKYPRVLGQYLMACLGYPDCPEHAEEIIARADKWDRDGQVLASAPAFPEAVWPKDRAVIKIAQVERAKGLKTLVFFTQTEKRSPIPRLKRHLEAAGLTVLVLDGSIAPDKREEWLQARVAEGFDVMLTNGRLVETGLDLLFATTIIQYGTEYSISTLRQSTRRSWRLGQTRPVKVYYLAYKGTMQGIATTLVSKKMRAAELVDGDDLGGLSQHDTGGHDFLLELAKAAAQAGEETISGDPL